MKIGSHVGMNGKKMFLGSVEEIVSYGGNAVMIYTGAPQNPRRKAISELNIDEGKELMKKHNILLTDVVVHAPYIINLGNSVNKDTFSIAVEFLRKEIERTAAIGVSQIVLHPGAHVGEGTEKGIKKIIEGLNEVITKEQTVKIALETMSGKGSECGKRFEELAQIIEGVKYNEKLTICFDTCHVHDSGYDIVHDLDSVLQEFDHILGLKLISVFHINDSKNPCGASKDRHENIGMGYIGYETLYKIISDKTFDSIPKILETPYVPLDNQTFAPYKFEIEMLKSGIFDKNIREKIIAQ